MTDATLRLNADTTGLKKATTALDKVTKASGRTEKATNKLSKSYAGLGRVVGRLAGIFAGGLLFRGIIKNTIEQEKATAQLNAALKSTGRTAEGASEALQDYASELQSVTTFGDEAIIGSQALLATFKEIGGDVFPRATRAILDMSIAMGQGLKESTIQVGKALNDPIRGLTALQRVGITFTDTQKEMIKAMQEAGDVAGAQALILKELESQFEGSAEAARNTFGGALEALGNAFGDLLEGEGGGDGLNAATDAINELVDLLNSPEVRQGFADITEGAFKFLGVLAQLPATIGFVKDEILQLFDIVDRDDFDRREEQIVDLRKELVLLERQAKNFGFTDGNPFIEPAENLRDLIELQEASIEIDRRASLATRKDDSPRSRVAETISVVDTTGTENATAAQDAYNSELEKTLELVTVTAEKKRATDATQILRDLEYETSQIGKTNQQIETQNALRDVQINQLIRATELGQAGIELNAAENVAIAETIQRKYELLEVDRLQREQAELLAEEQRQQAEATAALYRQIGNNAADALGAWVTGSKSAKEAFKDFADQVIKDLIRIAIQQAITAAIGGSPSGGGFGDFFQGLFGKATGGRVNPGSAQQVNERNPELLSVGGKDYLMMGSQGGNVTPITQTTTNNRNQTNVFNLPRNVTPKTAEQIAYATSKELKRVNARNM